MDVLLKARMTHTTPGVRPRERSRWLLLSIGCAVAALNAASHAAPGPVDPLERAAQPSPRAATSVLMAVTRADRRLVAVGELGVVLLSDDHGRSWRQARVPVSVALTNVSFASALNGWAVGHGGVVLRTTDGGESWVKQLDGKQLAQIELDAAKAAASTASPAGQRRLAAAQRLVADGPDKPLLDVRFFDERTGLVVGAYGLVFATRDGGTTWQSLMGRIENPKSRHLYSIQAVGAEIVLAGEQGALYRSTDSGNRFAEMHSPYVGTFFGAVAGQAGDLLVFGLRGNAYWIGNAGATWQRIDTGLPATITAGTRLADGSLAVVDETGRVLRSSDGRRGYKAVPVARGTSLTGIAQAADGALIVAGARGASRIASGDFAEGAAK